MDPARRAGLGLDGVEPRFLARPESSSELADVLRQANELGLAVCPRGGGSRMALGNRPSRLDLVVDTTALDRVIEYEPADLTVTVEAGMRFSRLQELLRAEGQLLALDPPASPDSTIGGVIATNASGPLRFAYGTARDLVIGTRVANPDGRLTRAGGRVVKNVAGYDLNKLHVGSLGTLGVLVELSFKLAPIPPAQALIVGRFEDSGSARSLLDAVLHSPLSPMAIELLGPAAAEKAGMARGLSHVLKVGGYPQAVERQARDLGALIAKHGGQRVEAAEDTWDAVQSMALRIGRDVLVKATAPIAHSVTLVELLERELARFDPIVWAHAGNGVAFAAFAAQDGSTAPLLTTLLESRRQVAALGSNASLVVQRCPTWLKESLDVWGDPGDGLGLMRAIKQQLDPRGTLNPGRYVGGI
jgi:glycolate oxidase FAD binding subunit